MAKIRTGKFAVYFYTNTFSGLPSMKVGKVGRSMVTEWVRHNVGTIDKRRAVYADKYLAFFDTFEEAEKAIDEADGVYMEHDKRISKTYKAWDSARKTGVEALIAKLLNTGK